MTGDAYDSVRIIIAQALEGAGTLLFLECFYYQDPGTKGAETLLFLECFYQDLNTGCAQDPIIFRV